MALEPPASPTGLSTRPRAAEWIKEYETEPGHFGADAARVNEQPRTDNALYVRDHDRSILCCECVDACGERGRNAFAVAVAGRGLDARVPSEPDTAQTRTRTVCACCGAGCNVTPHAQDDEIVGVTSPHDDPVPHGNLCDKGRFGCQHVQNRD